MEMKMEMHTPDSFRAIHGLDIRPRRRAPLRRWFSSLVQCAQDATRGRRAYKRLNGTMRPEPRDGVQERADFRAINLDRQQAMRRWRGV